MLFRSHHFVKKEFSFVIPLLKKWIENGLNRRKQLYLYKGEAWQSFNQRYAPSIIDELLPAALNASIVETESPYRTPWSSRNINSSEHKIVQMMQASLNQIAEDDPDKLIRVITQWNFSASSIRAELFLHAVEDNEYNETHLLKAFSLCQLFLEKHKECELDSKLPQFFERCDSEANVTRQAELFRRIRNKIAHGDFLAFETVVET